MEIRKASTKDFKRLIKYYSEKSLIELQNIIPQWAYGSDSDKMQDRMLHPKEEEYFIFLVNTKELFRIAEFEKVNTEVLFTGEILNDGRIATILHRWNKNLFIDPPTIAIFDIDKSKISFSDGRHRSKINYLLGHEQMPIAIHKAQIDYVKALLRLTPI